MPVEVNEGEFTQLASLCESVASDISPGAEVGSQSAAASTAMPGGTSGDALVNATKAIDDMVRQLADSASETADAGVATESAFANTDAAHESVMSSIKTAPQVLNSYVSSLF